MVNFYCRSCGLYISVPAEFAGGRGVCPRCKTPLRIPRSLPENHPDYVEGLRYIADPFNTAPLPPSERPPIATRELGPSSRFTCKKCGREFESLRPAGRPQGQCPNCSEVCETPTVLSVDFPRNFASSGQPAQVTAPTEGGWSMDGDFLVAPRSANQDPSDSIIQGLPLQPSDLKAVGSALDGAQKCTPDIEAQLAATLSPQSAQSAAQPVDRRQWFYLLREQQHGPVSTAKLQSLIQAGKVGLSVLVFHEGLKGWRPIEEFEELRACAKANETDERIASPVPSVDTQPSTTLNVHELRRLHKKFVSLLGIFVAAGFVFTLGVIMKSSLYALGQTFFLWVNLILSFLIFLCVVYGFLLIRRRWFYFREAPSSVRLRAWIGMAGLLACMFTTLILPLSWRGENRVSLDRDSILLAQRVFTVLQQGNVKASYVIVNWKELNVAGHVYGEEFHDTRSEEDRQKLMDSVCNVFLTAFEPYFVQEEMHYPIHLGTWRVVSRSAGDTVVEVLIPSTGKRIHFTLRAGCLVAMNVI
jgi:hypothetical protein